MITLQDAGHVDLWAKILNRILGTDPNRTLLDLCCGNMGQMYRFPFQKIYGVDMVDWEGRQKTYPFAVHDVRSTSLPDSFPIHFDAVHCSDGIEHMLKYDGVRVIKWLPTVAKISAVFIPSGNVCVDEKSMSSSDPFLHKSIWQPEDLEAMGWKVENYPRWHGHFGAFFAWTP